METRNYILATAGHVDHGKSALVRALTGIDPDRLPEEKARGMTIDLGFAHFDLPGKDAEGPTFRVGIVDVPGHEDFVKNMVAGVGSIDVALLVVAADDGWMPQTEEHLQILTYLNVGRGVIALTKIDRVPARDSVIQNIRCKLEASALADAPIVPTSVTDGRGIEQLREALRTTLSRTPLHRDIGKPRLAVDRAFTLHGIGTVVTGTLSGGKLARGEQVIIQPAATPAKIRTIQSYNHEVSEAAPGSRVALNLPDLQPGISVRRGDVVTLAGLGESHDTWDVVLDFPPRAPAGKPLKHGTRVRLHHGTANVPAIVRLMDPASTVSSGGATNFALAQLRLSSPAFAFAGDRFILRDWSERQTLAGGTVLDPLASRRCFRTETRRRFLICSAKHPEDAGVFVHGQLERNHLVKTADLLVQSRFSAGEISQAVESLTREGAIVNFGDEVADAAWWRSLRSQALTALDSLHAAHPEAPGMPLVELKQSLFAGNPPFDLFEALVTELCRNECVREGLIIRRSAHRPALPPDLRVTADNLLAALLAHGLETPSRSQLAPDPASQQALRFLVHSGEAVEITADLVIHREQYRKTIRTIREFLAHRGSATVSELKQTLNTSRRVMVPLLEKLDREGITMRRADLRTLPER